MKLVLPTLNLCKVYALHFHLFFSDYKSELVYITSFHKRKTPSVSEAFSACPASYLKILARGFKI